MWPVKNYLITFLNIIEYIFFFLWWLKQFPNFRNLYVQLKTKYPVLQFKKKEKNRMMTERPHKMSNTVIVYESKIIKHYKHKKKKYF